MTGDCRVFIAYKWGDSFNVRVAKDITSSAVLQ